MLQCFYYIYPLLLIKKSVQILLELQKNNCDESLFENSQTLWNLHIDFLTKQHQNYPGTLFCSFHLQMKKIIIFMFIINKIQPPKHVWDMQINFKKVFWEANLTSKSKSE